MAFQKTENAVFETIKVLALDLITIEGKRINLTEIFLGLQLYESIFEHFMSGKIFISDTYDLYKNESLSGNEEIQITLQERPADIQRVYSFRLYKINRDFDVTRTSAKSKILECYFFSAEKQIDNLTRISKKYSDFPEFVVEDIIRNVYMSSKEIFVDYTSTEVEYYSGYVTGSTVIDYMAKNAVSNFGDLDYIFFESMAGFHFVPLSLLLGKASVENLRYISKREMTFRVDDMQFFSQDAYFDLNIDAKRGMFGKTLYKMTDNDRYGIVKTAATYADNAGNFLTNGRNLLFTDELFTSNNMVKAHYHNHILGQIRSTLLAAPSTKSPVVS